MRHLIGLVVFAAMAAPLTAQDVSPAASATPAPSAQAPDSSAMPVIRVHARAAAPDTAGMGVVHGTVSSGTGQSAVALPGVSVTAKDAASGKTYATTTDINGAFSMRLPQGAKYTLTTDLAGFAESSSEITLSSADQLADFSVQLASRATAVAEKPAAAAPAQTAQTATPSLAAGATQAAAPGQRVAGAGRNRQIVRQGYGQQAGNRGARGNGTQTLDTTASDDGLTAAAAGGDVSMASDMGGGMSGIDSSVSTDSVAISGAQGQTNGLANYSQADIEQRMQAMREGGGFGPGGPDNAAMAGMLGGLMAGGPGGGGPGGGRGGPGGGRGGRGGGGAGGGGGFGGFGGFRQFNQNQIHGNVGYIGSNSVLNAQPWSPSGVPRPSTPYAQNNLTVSLTGSPYIPGLFKANPKQSLFLNGAMTHSSSPSIFQAIVPTSGNAALGETTNERAGDFSGLTQTVNGTTYNVQLYDPSTGAPIAGNNLANATTPISSQAQALLNYYPAPNIPVTDLGYNYQTVVTNATHQEQGSLRFTQNFGQAVGGGAGRRGGFGGGQRSGNNQNGPKTITQNISFSGAYQHRAADTHNVFLPLGGNTDSTGWNISFSHSIGYGRLRNNATVTFNRSNAFTSNYFTNGNVSPGANANVSVGSTLIQNNPFNYGVPGLSFGSSTFQSLSDTQPSQSIGQTISFSDFVTWRHGKHNYRFGGDIRRVHNDTTGGGNVLGSFSFTGYATQNPSAGECTVGSAGCPPTGNGFADFLFGLPQTAQVQAAQYKIYLRQNVYDWYVQDDWRLAANLTITWGLRYEYFAPLNEENNHLVNLDHNADFTQIAQVLPGQTGSISGMRYPKSLVHPDHNLYSPRIGFAYRVPWLKGTLLRGGYGINYTTNQYQTFARQLAFQPPFSLTQTNNANTPNITGSPGCTGASPGVTPTLTLAHGFNCSTQAVQNSYAVNPNYKLGYVHVVNLALQKSLPAGIVLNVGYNGSFGADQDILRIPNRTATTLLDPNATIFTYEDSLGYSRFNSLSVTANKRLQHGIALTATYAYGHSIDNASAIGGGGNGTIAQNDADLNAEEANSTFDVRHKVGGTFLFELPFGPGRMFLAKGTGFAAHVLDGWGLSGNYSFATGTYATPKYTLTVAQAATSAGNAPLRPNRVAGQSITGPKSKTEWFNVNAFSAPASGTFGNASRNSIELPGQESLNMILSRIIQLGGTRSIMLQFQANNALNLVNWNNVNTTFGGPQYGQVTSANPMRSITYTARYRF